MFSRLRHAWHSAFRPAAAEVGGLAAPLTVREVLDRFGPSIKPFRWQLAVTLLLAMLSPLLETLSISLYGRLIDDVLTPRQLGPLTGIAAAYLGLTLIGGALGFGRSYLSAWIAEHLLFDLRNNLFRHLQHLPLAFFERERLGDTVTRVTDDVDELGDFLASGVAGGVSDLLKIIFFTGALFVIDVRLALISLIVAPPFWLLGRRFATRVRRLSREQRAQDGAVTAIVEENLGNAALIQAYNGQAAAARGFAGQTRNVLDTRLALERLRAGFAPVVDLVEVTGMLIVVGAGAYDLVDGRITLGGLLVFLAYLSQLYGPVRGLNHFWSDAMSASAAAERVIELLDRQPAVTELAAPVPIGREPGEIRVEGVSYTYDGAHRPALDDISFDVRPGETVALVGPSGAGKSTITRLLLRLDDPAAGRIRLNGRDLRERGLTDLRDHVTLLPQEALFFDAPVGEAIAHGRPGATEEEIVAAARIAGADEFITRLPAGYATQVGQRGRSLSGGQRQRVAIARAVLRDSPVLILDEPTTGLDQTNARQILAAIRRLMLGKTTILISHDLDLVREATTILVLEQGRIVEQGTHDALLADDGVYARLVRAGELGRRSETGEQAAREASLA